MILYLKKIDLFNCIAVFLGENLLYFFNIVIYIFSMLPNFTFSGYNADVICLQEVDKKVFKNCLQPFLGEQGLVGKFYGKGKDVAEGLACFYRKDRFK